VTVRSDRIAFVVAFATSLLLAGAPAIAQTVPLNPRVALKVGAIGAGSDAGIFIAQEKGFFHDEGLDVEIVSFRAAPQILPAVATGDVQVSGSAVGKR
jgi:NitT/TauT family transport system substrate-binding protein